MGLCHVFRIPRCNWLAASYKEAVSGICVQSHTPQTSHHRLFFTTSLQHLYNIFTPSLQHLYNIFTTDGGNLTDDDVSKLARLPLLSYLEIQYCDELGDQGLVHFSSLTNLRSLK